MYVKFILSNILSSKLIMYSNPKLYNHLSHTRFQKFTFENILNIELCDRYQRNIFINSTF